MYYVKDFDESLFDNPIELLKEIKKRNDINRGLAEDKKYTSKSLERTDGLLSIADISERYNLSENIITSAIKEGRLSPEVVIPLFSENAVASFVDACSKSISPVVFDFIDEVEHMHVNFSYKPLLVMAMIQKSNFRGEAALNDIVDFYFNYYASRIQKGLIAEKFDSTFMRHPDDRQAAKRTIVQYPLKIYMRKGFIDYSSKTGLVKFNPEIWQYIVNTGKSKITMSCEKVLNRYYGTDLKHN